MEDKIRTSRSNRTQLSQKTKSALLEYIRSTPTDGPIKLPNEDDLSRKLGVSRNVLRDALASLEEMGVVTRRRGRGTIANPRMAKAACRLDIAPELFRALQDSGYHPRTESLNLGFVFQNDPAFGEASDAYLNTETLFWVEDTVAAYCVDHIPGHLAQPARSSIFSLQDMSNYQFLQRYCHTTVAYTMSHLDAVLPEPQVAALMHLPPNTPVLLLDDHLYDLDHQIVGHSTLYLRSGLMDVQFLRKSW